MIIKTEDYGHFVKFEIIEQDQGKIFTIIRGTVKYEGCINWETNPECLAHSCDLQQLTQVCDRITTAYTHCMEILTRRIK